MYDLVNQKWAAQRAVQDREAQHKSVEAILAEAALANAQLAVARAVMRSAVSTVRSAASAVKVRFDRKGATRRDVAPSLPRGSSSQG